MTAIDPFHLPIEKPLRAGELRVRWLRPEGIAGELARSCESVLAPDELARANRYRVPAKRDEFVLARAFLRCLLTSFVTPARPPASWELELSEHGKPRLARGAETCFNVSHCDGLVACAFLLGSEVGVDAERADRPGEVGGLARRYFAREEIVELESLPEPARRERFTRIWTLKEAYLKARGLGLRAPLDGFAFGGTGTPRPFLRPGPGPGDDASRWSLHLLEPSARHRLAVAAAFVPGAEPRLDARDLTPGATGTSAAAVGSGSGSGT